MVDLTSMCRAGAPALLALWLAACGGGGGGGGGADSEGAPTGSDEPTMSLGVGTAPAPGDVLADELADLTSGGAAQALQLAQLGTDLAHRLAGPGGPTSVTARCAGGGTFTATLEDRDGNGRAGPGDNVSASFSQCGLPVLQRVATGTVRVDILTGASAGIETDLRARISLGGSGLALASGALAQPTRALPAGTLSGSLAIHWSGTDAGAVLEATSTSDDNLQLDAPAAQPGILLAWRKIAVQRTVRFDEATVSTTMAFILERNGANGRAVVTTESPARADLNQLAATGTFAVRAAQGRMLRVRFDTTPGIPVQAQVLGREGQVLESIRTTSKPELGIATWDGRTLVGRGYPVAQGTSGDYFETPRDIESASNSLRTLFLPEPGSTVLPEIDRLFLHPVVLAAGAAASGATYRWQSGSALEDQQPTLFFRFYDRMAGLDEILPRASVPATVVRHGALYVIRPQERLHHATSYELQASIDGVNWSESGDGTTLRKRNGEQLRATGILAWLMTPGTLRVELDRFASIVVGADDSTSLRAQVTAARGQGIATMRWEQLSGEPLLLDSPNEAVTRVRYPTAAPRAAAPALFAFTVTDVLGNVEQARIVVRAGDVAPAGAAHYGRRTLSSRPGEVFRTFALGTGAVVANSPQAGQWALRLQPPPAFDTELFVGAPDGAPLAVGAYENSTFVVAVPGRPVMSCNTSLCAPPAVARFDVLEVTYDPEGRITRLALDYEQHTPGDITETIFGSYRYNSTVPLRR